MRYLVGAVLAALVTNQSPAVAQSDEVEFGPAPDWVGEMDVAAIPEDPEGMLFMRYSNLAVHLQDERQFTHVGYRARILQSQALEMGNLNLTWDPSSGTPLVHVLRIHRDGEVIDLLDTVSFNVIQRENLLEQAMLTGRLTAVLRVPDLRVGDELEFSSTFPSHDPTLADTSFGFLAMPGAPAAGRYRISLSWDQGQEPRVQMTDDLEGAQQRSARAIQINIDNPELISPPRAAPPRYSWTRILEFSNFASWPGVSQRFNALYDTASQLASDSPVKEEAARIARAHSGTLERAQAALELVQQQVRYIYVGLNGGNYRPATADETWQRRYGDCKGKTALLLALLRELGIDAEAVLVNNARGDDGLDTRLPNPILFDHVLVRATVDGTVLWMDATLPAVIGPNERPFIAYRWVLPLSTQGNELEAVPQRSFALPQEMGVLEIDARAGFDSPARRVSTHILRGVAGLQQYAQLSAMTSDQLTQALRNTMTGESTWDEIESAAYRYDRATQASILTITGHGPIDWDDRGENGRQLSLPGGGFTPPNRRQRGAGADADVPYYTAPGYSCYVTTVRIPEQTDVVNWQHNSTFDTMMFGRIYYRQMERRDDGTLRMIRGSRVEIPEISAERASRDNGRLSEFDNSRAWIFYDPAREVRSRSGAPAVPAAYEIDWAAPDVPCLPEDVLEGD